MHEVFVNGVFSGVTPAAREYLNSFCDVRTGLSRTHAEYFQEPLAFRSGRWASEPGSAIREIHISLIDFNRVDSWRLHLIIEVIVHVNDRRVDYTCCQVNSYRLHRARLRPNHQISQLRSHDILRMQFTPSRFTRLSRFHVEPARSRLGIEVENVFCEAAFQKVIMRCITCLLAENGERSIEMTWPSGIRFDWDCWKVK